MADEKPSWQRDEEEEEEEDLDESYVQQKDAILFAIDVSSSMLKAPPPSDSKKADTDSPTLAALKCAYQIMQQRVISSPKDMMGVLLFGTEQTKFQEEESGSRGSLQYPHCYLLTDLDVPAAEDVKTLKAIVEGEDESIELLKPTSEPVSMSNLLFCANQIFTTKAPNFSSRRLFIITDNDNPHSSDKSLQSQAQVRAKDLYDLGVTIELFPISSSEHEFDRTKFYDDILYRDPSASEDADLAPVSFKSGSGGISLLNDLIKDVNSKQVAKRALFSGVPLEIGPGLQISVKGYNILHKQTPSRSCYIWDKGEELQVPSWTSERMLGDITVEKTNIRKAYKFAGTQVLFDESEMKELKNWGAPVIRIIGFKPQSMLPIWASMKKSTFIYPSEEHFIGSTRTFSALWQKLLKDNLMGVAWHIARTNASPILVAVLPSAERLDDNKKHQLTPAGLWLYQLPFADDIRNPPPVARPIVASDALIDQMRTIIQQLQLPSARYDPSRYSNKALQWHYKLLQVAALGDDVPEDMDDQTIPKYRQIKKRSGKYMQDWNEILEKEAENHQRSYGGHDGPLKRDASDDEDEKKPKKKVKTEKAASLDSMTNDEVRKLIAKGTLEKHSVAELKDFLTAKGQRATGKKGDLVDRVTEWIEDQ